MLISKIIPPFKTYFIHGIKAWNKSTILGNFPPEICVSLQKDGKTVPLRPYGFIIDIDKGGIVRAYSQDVASKHLNGQKICHHKNHLLKYTENELEDLIKNTRSSYHNEIWVKSEAVEIKGAYFISSSHGSKSFLKMCKREGIKIHHPG